MASPGAAEEIADHIRHAGNRSQGGPEIARQGVAGRKVCFWPHPGLAGRLRAAQRLGPALWLVSPGARCEVARGRLAAAGRRVTAPATIAVVQERHLLRHLRGIGAAGDGSTGRRSLASATPVREYPVRWTRSPDELYSGFPTAERRASRRSGDARLAGHFLRRPVLRSTGVSCGVQFFLDRLQRRSWDFSACKHWRIGGGRRTRGDDSMKQSLASCPLATCSAGSSPRRCSSRSSRNSSTDCRPPGTRQSPLDSGPPHCWNRPATSGARCARRENTAAHRRQILDGLDLLRSKDLLGLGLCGRFDRRIVRLQIGRIGDP